MLYFDKTTNAILCVGMESVMNNITLIGMPATGKSTVGVILAKLLGYNFVDCDIMISNREHSPLSDIISRVGYDNFIEIEGQVGAEIDCNNTVIATGGSMVFSKNAMENFKKIGTVVWLDTPVDTLEKRLVGTLAERGVATSTPMTFTEIYELREPLYKKYADIIITCEGSTENVVMSVKDELIKRKLV